MTTITGIAVDVRCDRMLWSPLHLNYMFRVRLSPNTTSRHLRTTIHINQITLKRSPTNGREAKSSE